MAWTCTALLLMAGLLRGLVVCTPDDGVAHIEFAHAEGQCCQHDAPGHGASEHCPDDGETLGGGALRDDAKCSHIDLAIPLAPNPQPDAHDLPDDAPLVAVPFDDGPAPHSHARPDRHPPATGPPRPASLLRHRRTVVLQL